jgi:hypothetical protein
MAAAAGEVRNLHLGKAHVTRKSTLLDHQRIIGYGLVAKCSMGLLETRL